MLAAPGDYLRARRVLPATVLALIGSLMLAGCASRQVEVDSEWKGDSSDKQAFSRILIIGLTPEYNARCAFERFMRAEMKETSAVGIPSCDGMKSTEELSREAIERLIKEFNADAVLATSLVSASSEGREGGTLETQGDAYYKATGYGYWHPYYGVYGVPVVYGEFKTAPPITTVEGEIEIDSKLYETANAKLVYEMTTKARDLESRATGLAEVTEPIVARMKRDGLIR